jgi:hypothetical protein
MLLQCMRAAILPLPCRLHGLLESALHFFTSGWRQPEVVRDAPEPAINGPKFGRKHRVGLAQLVRFPIMELTYLDSNPRFDIDVIFMTNYFFSDRRHLHQQRGAPKLPRTT